MALDPMAVLAICAVFLLWTTLVLLFLVAVSREWVAGTTQWIGGSLALMGGLSLLLIREEPFLVSFWSFAANFLMILAFSLLEAGTLRFLGRRVPYWLVAGIPLAGAVANMIFRTVWVWPEGRMLAFRGSVAIILVLSIAGQIRSRRPRPAYVWTTVGVTGFGLAIFAGWSLLPFFWPDMAPIPGPFDAVFYVLAASFAIAVSLNQFSLLHSLHAEALKKAADYLLASQERFRAIFEASADAMFLLTPAGRIIEANQTAQERLGYSLREFREMNLNQLHGPWDEDPTPDALERVLRDGVLQMVVRHQTKDGHLIPTEINSRMIHLGGQPHLLTVARDISQRLAVEEEIRRSRKHLELLFEATASAHSFFDPSGRMVLCNQACADLLGLANGSAAVGRTFEDLFEADLAASMRARMNRVLASGGVDTQLSNTSTPRGSRWLRSTYASLQEGGEAVGVHIIVEDVTESHLYQEQLRRAEKSETLETLAGGIAHDFNNLLGGIFGSLELTKIYLDEGNVAAATDRLARTFPVLSRARALTRQLLSFSKGGATVKERASLARHLEEWARFSLSGSDQTLRLSVAADLHPCYCDVEQIGQVIDNVLVNARQASPSGGCIDLTARNSESDGVPMIQIVITDDGPGVPAEVRERIFDPYFTTKSLGTGLGLSVSKSIVESHGGTLRLAENSVGVRGSTFVILLPAADAGPVPPPAETVPEVRFSGHAVVMDDEEVLRDTVGRLLESLGLVVTAFADGFQVVEFIQSQRAQGRPTPDVVLLDLTVPGGWGGDTTATRLRSDGFQGPLVAMTGYSRFQVSTESPPGLFRALLRKPFERRELIKVLSTVLTQSSR